MPSDAWKAIERHVAEIAGGIRWWNSELDIDVRVGEWGIETKNLKAPTVADLERYLAHNKLKCEAHDPPLKNALVVKRKAGRGAKTPYLLVIPLEG